MSSDNIDKYSVSKEWSIDLKHCQLSLYTHNTDIALLLSSAELQRISYGNGKTKNDKVIGPCRQDALSLQTCSLQITTQIIKHRQ